MANILASLGRALTNPYNIAAGVGTVASGGGLAAMLPLLGRVGLGAGVDYAQQGRQDKFNRRQKKAQARANLMQAISPRGERFEAPVDVPKAGILEKFGTAAQTGLSVADAYQTAKSAASAAANQDRLRQLQISKAEREAAAAQTLGRRQIGADAATAGLKGIPGEITSFKTGLTRPGIQPLDEAPLDVRAGFETAQQATADAGLDRSFRESQIALNTARATAVGGDNSANAQSKTLKLAAEGLKPYLRLNPVLTFEEFISIPETQSVISKLNEEGRARLRTSFTVHQQELFDSLQNKTTEVLFKSLSPRINQDALLKNVGNLQFAYATMISGFDQNNGFGDIGMIVGNVRMSDPAVSVRAEDIKTQEQALTYIDRLAVFVSGERIFGAGGRLLPSARKRLLESGKDLYRRNLKQVNNKLDKFTAVGLQALPAGVQNGEQRVNTFLDTYRLPSIGSFSFDATSDSARVDLGAQQRGGGVGTMGGFGFPTRSQMAEQFLAMSQSSDPVTASLGLKQLQKLMGRP